MVRPIHREAAREREVRPAEALGFVVSDLAVLQALQTRYARRPLSAEQLRTAKLVALVAFVRAGESETSGGGTPWTAEFPLDIDPLARLIGIQPAQAEAVVGYLREAGVLHQVQSAGSVWYRLAEAVFERAAAAEALDWSAILATLEGESAALLVVRALADLLPPPFTEWVSVRVSTLSEHTGYGSITVRKGKDVLVQTGLLEEEAHAGQTSRYRFTPFAQGRSTRPPAPSVPSQAAPPSPPAADRAPRSISESPAPAARIELATVSVQIAGLHLELPQGTTIRLEVGSDGRERVHVGDHLVLGPL